MRVAWGIAMVAACSFAPGRLEPDGGGDDTQLTGDDGSAGTSACVDKWIAGPTLSPPMPLTSVDSADDEADPFISHDELTIYFVRNDDIYAASRMSITDPFGAAAKNTNLSTQYIDTKLSMTDDGLHVFIDTSRPNGVGATDIWHGERTSTSNLFTWNQQYLTAINTSADQWDPHISANGLRLYYAPTRSVAQTIVVAKRTSITGNFGAPTVIMELDSKMIDNDPTLSGDERLIVFASERGGVRRLWYATRVSADDPFGSPQMIPALDNATDDGGTLSSDGCRLYFVSDRNGNGDLFVTSVQ